jgi:hypothetical protein
VLSDVSSFHAKHKHQNGVTVTMVNFDDDSKETTMMEGELAPVDNGQPWEELVPCSVANFGQHQLEQRCFERPGASAADFGGHLPAARRPCAVAEDGAHTVVAEEPCTAVAWELPQSFVHWATEPSLQPAFLVVTMDE